MTTVREPRGPAGPMMTTRAKAAEIEAKKAAEILAADEAEKPKPPPAPKVTGMEYVLILSETLGHGFSRLTYAANMPGGCVIRTEMKNKRNRGMGIETSESMCFVPGVEWDATRQAFVKGV